jgi:DNA-binding NarL/FixJ family response regulator
VTYVIAEPDIHTQLQVGDPRPLKDGTVIKDLIVDDHSFVRFSISELLDRAGGIAVVGECADGAHVVGAALAVTPDVVLMDLCMPGISGLDATRLLLKAQPLARVLVFSGSTICGTALDAARAGAVGYLLKGGDAQELVTAIRVVAAGGTAWPGEPRGGPRIRAGMTHQHNAVG